MSDPFVEQLKQVCRDHPVQTKWVMVPYPGLRWTLAERLLLEGCNWLNLRIVTPFQLALEEAAPRLLAEGVNPSPDSLGPSLLQNFLHQRSGYFAPLILQPGMAEALWRSLQEFRMAGLRSKDLRRLPANERREELIWLTRRYEEHLKKESLADRATLFEASSGKAVASQDWLIVYPFHRFSPLEFRWMQGLEARKLKPCAATAAPADCPGWWPRQMQPTAPAGTQFFVATRRHDEIDEVARRLLEGRIPLDQVELAAPLEDYPLIADRMAAFGFPCTFDTGLPAALARPGQALEALLTWLEHGLTAHHLQELLRADLLRARPDSFTAAYLLEAARISWGRETYHTQLRALAELSRRRAAHDPDAAEPSNLPADTESLMGWLKVLFQRLPPENERDEIQPARWLSGLQETLVSDFVPRTPGEATAKQALIRALEELKMLPGDSWPLPRFLATVRGRLASLRALASRPRPGHLHVTSPTEMGLCGRAHLYWIGMEEGRILPLATADCVFSDSERALLHPALRLSSQAPLEHLNVLRDRLLSYGGQLTLSYACKDLTGEQDQLPTWLYVERSQDRAVATTRTSLERPLDTQTLFQLYPHLARGAEAERQRHSDEFTVFDGWVPAAAGRWDPRQTGQPISVSRLASLATCPFRLFLENGLGLREPALALPESDTWLDAATRGTVLHEVYAAYHRGLAARGWRPDPARDRPQLHSLLDEQLEKVRQMLPAGSIALEKAERNSLKRELDHFLRLESQPDSRQPIAFEVPFGMGPDPLEPMALPEPVPIQLSEGSVLMVRGRIDRIDRIGQHYAVVDYKTGKRLYAASRNPTYDRGRLLQHALYALVVEFMIGEGSVQQSSYYFPTLSAVRSWRHFPYPDREHFTRVLTKVLEPLASGAFCHTHERDKDCRFCPYQTACEANLDAQSERKLQQPLLANRRRLLEEP